VKIIHSLNSNNNNKNNIYIRSYYIILSSKIISQKSCGGVSLMINIVHFFSAEALTESEAVAAAAAGAAGELA